MCVGGDARLAGMATPDHRRDGRGVVSTLLAAGPLGDDLEEGAGRRQEGLVEQERTSWLDDGQAAAGPEIAGGVDQVRGDGSVGHVQVGVHLDVGIDQAGLRPGGDGFDLGRVCLQLDDRGIGEVTLRLQLERRQPRLGGRRSELGIEHLEFFDDAPARTSTTVASPASGTKALNTATGVTVARAGRSERGRSEGRRRGHGRVLSRECRPIDRPSRNDDNRRPISPKAPSPNEAGRVGSRSGEPRPA